MLLRVTIPIIEAAYEYGRVSTPLFRETLPHVDDVEFSVTRKRNKCGHFVAGTIGNPHEIGISQSVIGSTLKLMEAMVHEQLHLYQEITRTFTPNTEHNAEFLRLAKRICKIHCFDVKAF